MRSTGAPVAIGRTPPLTLRFGRTFWLINPVAQGYVAIIFAIAGDRHDEKVMVPCLPAHFWPIRLMPKRTGVETKIRTHSTLSIAAVSARGLSAVNFPLPLPCSNISQVARVCGMANHCRESSSIRLHQEREPVPDSV